jgi:hypothetical protein
MAAQAPLLVEVNALARDWAVESPFSQADGPVGPEGYAGIELDVDAKLILVYWKYGIDPGPQVHGRLQQIQQNGISVDLIKAPYSYLDLRDELRAAVLAFNSENISLNRIGPSRGSLGLQIVTSEPERVLASVAYKNVVKRMKAKSKRPPENPVPVQVGPAYKNIRLNDRSPYWGGAMIVNASRTAGCTTAFAVGNIFGKYLLTAGHCANHTNGAFWRTGDGFSVGDTYGAQTVDPGSRDRLDVILIKGLFNCTRPDSLCTPSGTSEGRLYNGPVTTSGAAGPGAFRRDVKDRTVSVPGMIVCTSGAFSGDRCDLEVVAIEQRIATLLSGNIRGTVQVRHRLKESGGGNGDSGGPVFTVRGATTEANAAGVLSASTPSLVAPCTGVPESPPDRDCSSELFYTTIQDATRALDVWLETK